MLTLYVAEPTMNDNSSGNTDIYEEAIPLNPAAIDLEVSPLIWSDDNETKYDEEARLEAEQLQDLADAQPHPDDGPCAALSKWMVRNPEYKNILALACTFLLGTKVFKIGPFFHEDAPYESVQEYDHQMEADEAKLTPIDTRVDVERRRLPVSLFEATMISTLGHGGGAAYDSSLKTRRNNDFVHNTKTELYLGKVWLDVVKASEDEFWESKEKVIVDFVDGNPPDEQYGLSVSMYRLDDKFETHPDNDKKLTFSNDQLRTESLERF